MCVGGEYAGWREGHEAGSESWGWQPGSPGEAVGGGGGGWRGRGWGGHSRSGGGGGRGTQGCGLALPGTVHSRLGPPAPSQPAGVPIGRLRHTDPEADRRTEEPF